MSAASGAETVTAGVESGLEDRLPYLEQSLLNHPIHDVGNAEPSLPAPWLWQPDAADFAGPVASLQQVSAQTGDQRRGLRLGRLDRLTTTPGAPLLRTTFNSARARLASGGW